MDPEIAWTRVNVTIRRESPVNSYLLTFIDISEDTNPLNLIHNLYPGWIIIRMWANNLEGDRIRHKILSDDIEWHILTYECDK